VSLAASERFSKCGLRAERTPPSLPGHGCWQQLSSRAGNQLLGRMGEEQGAAPCPGFAVVARGLEVAAGELAVAFNRLFPQVVCGIPAPPRAG